MSDYIIPSLEALVEQFESLPSIGHKTALRLSYFILNQSKEYVDGFSQAMLKAYTSIKKCKICCNLTDQEICSICSDDKRDRSVICVLTSPKDVFPFERTNEFHGLYHVLNGEISPMNGISPNDINIKELIDRVKQSNVKEIIMATNPTIEGEATSMYISRLLKPYNLKITRLAYGIPIGADLEYTDEITLSRALNGRQSLL